MTDEFTLPLTPHDKRIVRDTVVRAFELDEVSLLLDWANEVWRSRPLTAKEEQLANLLLAQHCALYAEALHNEVLEKRKEHCEQTRHTHRLGTASSHDSAHGATPDNDAGVSGEGP